ncbi:MULTISPECIES: Holliday junction resolvase RuvX [Alkalihalophilus]|uniref:Holliday junction resolvase RuvX n=1 Tax=Alkalihalophilus TaxID=2893060 RepID=UPI00259B22F3|nr:MULTISPECIES: Holliday junction resolvase RuvX [Alkalihalophilus]MEC2072150.1 Holliday junction resolvase RuvX [Alkalihalophilus marmarensis]WEG17709.1 Holliday junction resolvase RuvX [Alkalihalophilus pseudofirmus]
MRALGLDVGTKTVGIALSDELGWTAQGIETLRRNEEDPESDFLKIAELAKQNDVGTIVIGLPKNMNGTIGPSGERCMEFADSLKEHLDCEFVMWDERLTTVAAERMLVSADVSRKKRKKVIDKMAAVMILQGYLDRKGM